MQLINDACIYWTSQESNLDTVTMKRFFLFMTILIDEEEFMTTITTTTGKPMCTS